MISAHNLTSVFIESFAINLLLPLHSQTSILFDYFYLFILVLLGLASTLPPECPPALGFFFVVIFALAIFQIGFHIFPWASLDHNLPTYTCHNSWNYRFILPCPDCWLRLGFTNFFAQNILYLWSFQVVEIKGSNNCTQPQILIL
jgi:hypothetical protein